ncbi:MAG TPA: DUF4190 domain-containing protein [Phycisphaerae bacterium]|nr:DUF4190 domain-containing protein [Phycisphaerae bacterium]HNU43808.1 DUF4190 domain-containing protein [Phycisphaerae bacterium]
MAPPVPCGPVPEPTTRAASVVALVLGLILCIPFVTQSAALVVGFVAILRPRRERERVTAAWVGIGLALVGLVGWGVAWTVGVTTSARMGAMGTFPAFPPAPGSVPNPDLHALEERLERLHRAALAYHRDFQRWPPDVDSLTATYLPAGSRLEPDITYRPPPAESATPSDWILAYSARVTADASGNPLSTPHRLALRISGGIDLVPARDIETPAQENP